MPRCEARKGKANKQIVYESRDSGQQQHRGSRPRHIGFRYLAMYAKPTPYFKVLKGEEAAPFLELCVVHRDQVSVYSLFLRSLYPKLSSQRSQAALALPRDCAVMRSFAAVLSSEDLDSIVTLWEFCAGTRIFEVWGAWRD